MLPCQLRQKKTERTAMAIDAERRHVRRRTNNAASNASVDYAPRSSRLRASAECLRRHANMRHITPMRHAAARASFVGNAL